MEKLWTTSEVAQFLGVTEPEVEALIRQGTLSGYKLGGQFLRFRPDQVAAVKHAGAFRAVHGRATPRPRAGWLSRGREFLYVYDFYVVSAVLLALVVVYLIAAG
jgi:excisionase family DNA binding protein